MSAARILPFRRPEAPRMALSVPAAEVARLAGSRLGFRVFVEGGRVFVVAGEDEPGRDRWPLGPDVLRRLAAEGAGLTIEVASDGPYEIRVRPTP